MLMLDLVPRGIDNGHVSIFKRPQTSLLDSALNYIQDHSFMHPTNAEIQERPPPVPDSLYNLDLVSFRVENTVFRVPKQAFDLEETIFKDMFALPAPVSEIQEGSSNEYPIYLEGIEADDFRSFLRVLCPLGQPPVTELKVWIGALALATLWHFTEVRAEAIEAISQKMKGMGVLQRIHLGRKCNSEKWVQDAYIELLNKQTLMLDELSGPSLEYSLDWPTIAKIFYIRDNRDFFNLPLPPPVEDSAREPNSYWGTWDEPCTPRKIKKSKHSAINVIDPKVAVINIIFAEEFKDIQQKAVG
ncbi:hypothetical protein JR316_0000215 [Psilocybe cubensis]|uniref:Uncharacterized protein n=2 Tax=Psilocybe cubensis TaxID=181762 RepID=A0ACB8HE42_PSICU|nr:hypothetical protein JR316_0000215 [Psilocybe cubensis]KAH9486151.1 hypothetical protein JR316_0000215 [Psilocybe cubensis]